jgi:hypothetical protein
MTSAFTLAACGGGGGGGSSTEKAAPPSTAPIPGAAGTGKANPKSSSSFPAMDSTPTTAPSKVISAFAACLRQHGFNVPDDLQKWTPPPGTDQAKAQTAVTACFQYMTSHPTS